MTQTFTVYSDGQTERQDITYENGQFKIVRTAGLAPVTTPIDAKTTPSPSQEK